MKNYNIIELIKWLGWVLFIVCFFKCKPDSKEILIPEYVGSFKPKVEIVQIPVNKTLEVPKWYKDVKTEKELFQKNKELNERISVYQKEVDSLIINYNTLDSLERINAYIEANKLNKFSAEFDDDRIKLFVEGVVRGEVKELTPSYMIKEQKINIDDLKKNSLFLGLGAGISSEMNQFTAKANLSLQNKKENIYTISFQRIGNQNFGLFEYNFKIKK